MLSIAMDVQFVFRFSPVPHHQLHYTHGGRVWGGCDAMDWREDAQQPNRCRQAVQFVRSVQLANFQIKMMLDFIMKVGVSHWYDCFFIGWLKKHNIIRPMFFGLFFPSFFVFRVFYFFQWIFVFDDFI